jgi:hypothetical protein
MTYGKRINPFLPFFLFQYFSFSPTKTQRLIKQTPFTTYNDNTQAHAIIDINDTSLRQSQSGTSD